MFTSHPRLDIHRMRHDYSLAALFGVARTLELLSCNYWFPSMSTYVSTYDICSRGKLPRHLKHSELNAAPGPLGAMERN
jgi:hypothetical protein